jgi:GTP-binding protein Era
MSGRGGRGSGGRGDGGRGEGNPLDLEALLADIDDPTPEGFRSGMLALVGRPNVGKSTLLNRMVGEQVAIVTDVPGTTRNAIRGVVERDDAQLVFLDTPGVAKPRTLLTRRLNELVESTWQGVDLICFLVDVADGIGPGDRFLAERLVATGTPIVAVANKEDRVTDKHKLLPELTELTELLDPLEVVPISATNGFNVDHLLDVLVAHLPEGPRLLPTGTVSDQAEPHLVAELIRGAYIELLHDELPHSVAVHVDEIEPREDGLIDVEATVFVERDSQKGIVIGKGGRTIRDAGAAARPPIEALLGGQVHLQLRIKIAKEWQRDPKQLRRMGY